MNTYVTSHEVTIHCDSLTMANLHRRHWHRTRGVVDEVYVISNAHQSSRKSATCRMDGIVNMVCISRLWKAICALTRKNPGIWTIIQKSSCTNGLPYTPSFLIDMHFWERYIVRIQFKLMIIKKVIPSFASDFGCCDRKLLHKKFHLERKMVRCELNKQTTNIMPLSFELQTEHNNITPVEC